MRETTGASVRKLYTFLSACGGNWRNTIHISDPGEHTGWLMAADRDGRPLVMAVDALQELVQECIDTTDCRGRLTASAFMDIFAGYILWQFPDANSSPAAVLNLLSTKL